MLPSIMGASVALVAAIVTFVASLDAFTIPHKEFFYQIIYGISASLAAGISIFVVMQLRKRAADMKSLRVFISYAREDLDKARQISGFLKENGFEPWLDAEQIEAGQIWKDVVSEGISKSKAAVALISQHFQHSRSAQKELHAVMSLLRSSRKSWSPIIPVRLDDTEVPYELRHIHWVDYFQPDGKQELLKGLKTLTSSS